jgi:hypothetical protein
LGPRQSWRARTRSACPDLDRNSRSTSIPAIRARLIHRDRFHITLRLANFFDVADGTRDARRLSVLSHGPNGPRFQPIPVAQRPSVLNKASDPFRRAVRQASRSPPHNSSPIAEDLDPNDPDFPATAMTCARKVFSRAHETFSSCPGDRFFPTQTVVLTGAWIHCRPATTSM